MLFHKTIKGILDEKLLIKKLSKENWLFSKVRIKLIVGEYLIWSKVYNPINLFGKVVLDIGAGEGETARFFINLRVKSVICIEPNNDCFKLLLRNSKFHKQIIPINSKFKLEHLKLSYDFLKMDIEGYEIELLNTKLVKPSVIETHSEYLTDKFRENNFRVFRENNSIGNTNYVFYNC